MIREQQASGIVAVCSAALASIKNNDSAATPLDRYNFGHYHLLKDFVHMASQGGATSFEDLASDTVLANTAPIGQRPNSIDYSVNARGKVADSDLLNRHGLEHVQ